MSVRLHFNTGQVKLFPIFYVNQIKMHLYVVPSTLTQNFIYTTIFNFLAPDTWIPCKPLTLKLFTVFSPILLSSHGAQNLIGGPSFPALNSSILNALHSQQFIIGLQFQGLFYLPGIFQFRPSVAFRDKGTRILQAPRMEQTLWQTLAAL